MTTRGIALVVSAALVAAVCAVATVRLPFAAADPNPDGEWTLTQIVEDDDSTHGPPIAMTIKYIVDAAEGTVENEWYLEDEGTPCEETTFNFVVTPSGTWYLEDAGPDGRSIEFSVECTASTLTLTRVAFSGPFCEIAPAPVYVQGTPAPPEPTTAPPPKKFILSR